MNPGSTRPSSPKVLGSPRSTPEDGAVTECAVVKTVEAPRVQSIQVARAQGRYAVLDKLGAGGMGTVHRARDESTGRLVAFKQLISSMAGGRRRTVETLFEREYHTLVRLKHPRIIEVYDYGVSDAGPYYTMELLDGRDLQQLGVLPFREACRHLRDVASSLALIHAHRLVHRDVSSRNIRLTNDGRAKLIDFGALASFGIAEDIVGTPHCMAPEIVHKMPLDQRTDLFALGAVAYRALTGRHAYPARHIAELFAVWETPPVPPSVFASDLPSELEALVMSLLSLDPLGRPPTAAAVIDQLSAIGGLDPEEHEHAAESYLSSSRMVGRAKEMEWLERRVERALRGQGAEVVVEGRTGIGKTRLLHEAGLQARLRGAIVLKADADAARDPFGVAEHLSLALLDASPEVARRAAGHNASILSHLSPRLADNLGDVVPVSLPTDAAERRARFQTALHEWFLAVSRECTLFVAVDNVQAADDNSAAFLAALGREARGTHMVLFVTQRKGAPVVAAAPVRMLRQRSSRLGLAGLSAEACEELVRSVFGEVPNTGRVAQLLFERSAGVPQQFMDLAQILVKRKIAKYGAGTWVLPQDVAEDELPSQAAEILTSRLAGLSSVARSLVETLCIQAKPILLERCLALAEGHTEAEVYSALDELVAEQILQSESGKYRFGHSALRDALLEGMNDEDRSARQIRAAEALLADDPDDPGARIEAALYLLDAGEERRGADMIATLGLGLLGTAYFNAASDAVLALSRALDVYERQGRSDYELAALLFPMMKLAYYSPHWRLILKHGERALSIGLRITGLALAQKLRPVLGRKLALAFGLIVGSLGFARQRRRGLGYDLKAAVVASCGILPAVTATHATCLDAVKVARLQKVVEPLTLFGPDHVAGLLYEWAPMQRLTVEGREGEARVVVTENIRRNQAPSARAALGEASWKSFSGGLLFPRSLFDAYAFGDGALRGAEELESLGIRVWAMAADQIRMLYHAFRGESEDVQRYRERVELFAVLGSTTWQAELFWPALLLNADVLTGDAIAARRTSEQLGRRAKDVESLERFAAAARAAYLMLRGDTSAAIALYEEILPSFPLRRSVAYETTRAYFAQALNLAGDHARAKTVVSEVIHGMVPEDHRIAVHFLEPQRQLALAEAGLGRHDEAIAILESLLSKHGGENNPLLVGLLHKARAEIAIMTKDTATLEHHLAEMEVRFRRTRNPALIAQWERLAERATRLMLTRTHDVRADADASGYFEAGSERSRALGDLSAAAEPCEYALQLVLQEAKAKSGFLYVYRRQSMELAAATGADDAPRHLEEALARLAETASSVSHSATSMDGTNIDLSGDGEPDTSDERLDRARSRGPESDETQTPSADEMDDGNTAFFSSAPPPRPCSSFQLLLLDAVDRKERAIVGGLIIEADPLRVARLDKEFLRGVARVLQQRRAMTSAFSNLS